ncbi:glycosyltransferase [Phyllobacterium sp. SB3]|uniref:glycosyltransferase n=1 Tax=Phyllobacterium sp. SB3 TaxID=3156073 RepID=UPI0032AEC20B
MASTTFLSESSFWDPEYVEPSAWLEHGPFAFWLTECLKPNAIVELGTYRGFSYFAFCQAVEKLGFDTKCYAVDTWKGDEHGGTYDESVFNLVKQHNTTRYSNFSRLIRSTFDEALSYFEDSSVDLLHIDGRHFYDDAKHDFDSWRPKLSDRAVVLFHDINVRERGFGVFKLWSELTARHPSFSFYHGHGLGILGVGKDLPRKLKALLNQSNDEAGTTRQFYGHLGHAITRQLELKERKIVHAGTLKTLSEQKEKIRALNNDRIELGLSTLQVLRDSRLSNEAFTLQRDQEVADITRKLNERLAELEASKKKITKELNERLQQNSNALRALNDTHQRLINSRTWRLVTKTKDVTQRIPLARTLISKGGPKVSASSKSSDKIAIITTIAAEAKPTSIGPGHRQADPPQTAARRSADYIFLDESGLFDKNWYNRVNPDVRESGKDALDHFLNYGAKEGRNPNPLFCTHWYASQNKIGDTNPLIHYLTVGYQQALPPHPLFDSKWYADNYLNSVTAGNPLKHYLQNRESGKFVTSPLFLEGAKYPSNNDNLGHYSVVTSPIFNRVPPTRYLQAFSTGKQKLHKDYCTLDEFNRLSFMRPRLIRADLSENDLRIIAMMDFEKRRLSERYMGKFDDLISVIMPTRNRAHLIMDAINSVLLQSYSNWELVVVDDGGSDELETVISSYGDSRIVYVRHEQYQGNAATRNTGIKHSRGNLVAYLDDDDAWDPDFLLVSIGHLKENNKRMVYSAQMIWEGFDNATRLGQKLRGVLYAPFNRSLLENTNIISMISCVHEKNLFEDVGVFNESLSRYVDWDLFLRITEVESPDCIPCILSHYFQRRDVTSVSLENSREDNMLALQFSLRERSSWSTQIFDEVGEGHYLFGLSKLTIQTRAKTLKSISANRIQIVIPNYEASSDLEQCLHSIREHTNRDYQITIVDNGSSARTRERIDDFVGKMDAVSWIPFDEQSGFTYAVNRGLALLPENTDDVLILNNDTIVTPAWLDELVYTLGASSDVGMSVPRQTLLRQHKIAQAHAPHTMPIHETDINVSVHHDNLLSVTAKPFQQEIELSYAPLFCTLIKRASLDALGPLDSGNGPHFRSDWILCQSLRSSLKQRILYTPFSKVYHMQGVSTRAHPAITR